MIVRAAIMTLSLLLTLRSAHAQFMVHGVGTKSCGEFIRVMDHYESDDSDRVDRLMMISWVDGFLTHYNGASADTVDILGGTDIEGATRWLYNYCRSHPITSLSNATQALVLALWPTRTTENHKH